MPGYESCESELKVVLQILSYLHTCISVLDLHLQVERFGKPTWRRLAEAVEDHVGGNNLALAQTVAREHPGALP